MRSHRTFTGLGLAIAALLVAVVVLGDAAGAWASTTANATQVSRALDYLHACQVTGGGFTEKGSSPSDAITAWAIIAIASAGEDPNEWTVDGESPLDYLVKQSGKWAQPTDVARTTLAVCAARKDPRSFGGVDLVAKLKSAARTQGDTVQYGAYVNSHIWTMIALHAAGETPPQSSVRWLLGQQNPDGGWGWAPGITSDSNDTAAALQALDAANADMGSAEVKRALSYLRGLQRTDGGFAYSATNSASDANSTAWVTQGIVAAGQDPTDWTRSGKTPRAYLRAAQAAAGYVRATAERANNPLLTTIQTIPAYREQAFPVVKPRRGAREPFRPAVEIRWPTNAQTVTSAKGAALRFTVADGVGVGVARSGVSVRVDGTKRAVTWSGGEARVSMAGLATGSHTVAVTAVDRAGNKTTLADWQFTLTAAAAHTLATQSTTPTSSTLASAPAGVTTGTAAGLTPTSAAAPAGTQTGQTSDITTQPVELDIEAPASSGGSGWMAAIGLVLLFGTGAAVALIRQR